MLSPRMGLGSLVHAISHMVSVDSVWEYLTMTQATGVLTAAANALVDRMMPVNGKHTYNAHLTHLLGTIIVVRSLRWLRSAYQRRVVPAWAVTWARCAGPGYLAAALEATGAAARDLWKLILAPPRSAAGAVTYLAGNFSCPYIGKAGLCRKNARSGVPDRLCEHIRLLLTRSDREQARYRIWRKQGVRGFIFLPTAVWQDSYTALQAENYAIGALRPAGNAEPTAAIRLRTDARRRRPPRTVRTRTLAPTRSLWDSMILDKPCRSRSADFARWCEAQWPSPIREMCAFGRHYRRVQQFLHVTQRLQGP